MKPWFGILFFALCSCTLFAANDAETLLDKGNRFYEHGDYHKAIELYEEAGKTHISDALYYNLGNSYFRIGAYPKAILNYERALRLNPDDEDIQTNLAIANTKIADQLEAMPEFFLNQWIQKFTGFFAIDIWAILAISVLFLAFTCLGIYFYVVSYGAKKVSFTFSMLFLLGTILCFASSMRQYKELNRTEYIIIQNTAALKSAPNASSTDQIILHEGSKVSYIESFENYVRVRAINGTRGWVQQEALEKI